MIFGSSAHLSGWARIETPFSRAGNGRSSVAPTFRGGRGLKLVSHAVKYAQLMRSAHLSGWARIETLKFLNRVLSRPGSAHLSGWARIETPNKTNCIVIRTGVAPTFRGGRGLKLSRTVIVPAKGLGSAHLSGWARIETIESWDNPEYVNGSAHLSGWARIETRTDLRACGERERSAHLSGWARIETLRIARH